MAAIIIQPEWFLIVSISDILSSFYFHILNITEEQWKKGKATKMKVLFADSFFPLTYSDKEKQVKTVTKSEGLLV